MLIVACIESKRGQCNLDLIMIIYAKQFRHPTKQNNVKGWMDTNNVSQ